MLNKIGMFGWIGSEWKGCFPFGQIDRSEIKPLCGTNQEKKETEIFDWNGKFHPNQSVPQFTFRPKIW